MALRYISRCKDHILRKYWTFWSRRCASSTQNRTMLSSDNGQIKDTGSKPLTDLCGQSAISFNDPAVVYKHKTTWELFRALCILKICSYDCIVDNSEKLMRLGSRVLGTRLFTAVMNPTFYRQFSGGDSREELMVCVSRLTKAGIGALLAVPTEEDVDESCRADDQCEHNLQTNLNCINMAAEVQTTYPMMQLKMTALFPAALCATLSKICPEPSRNPDLVKSTAWAMKSGTHVDIPDLSEEEQKDLRNGLTRLKIIGELAVDKQVIVMVDAEYTYINPALNLFTLAMMINYNNHSAVIFFTYQNYLKGTTDRLMRDVEFMDICGVCFGAKLVRGAYLIKERKLAKEQCYPDPVHDTFEDTSNMYHDSMELMLSRISKHPDEAKVIIASHNHRTVLLALKRLKWYNIDLTAGNVFLGQLYGIADHISCLLGNHGYPVYKSIPYGSLSDTLPYLSRRAQENRAIFQGVREERELLRAAVRARFWET